MKINPSSWTRRSGPPRLERRLEFVDYEQTRQFLADLAEVSEAAGYYPDVSFGRTYVSLTIGAEEQASDLDPERVELARRIDGLLTGAPTSC